MPQYLKSRTIHIDIICLFVCLFDLMRYVAVNNFSVMLGWFSVFLGRTSIKMHQCVCSRIHWHSDSAGGESWISILSIPSLTFYHLCPCAPLSSTDFPFSSVIKIAIHWLNLESKHMSWVRLWEPYWGVYSAAPFSPKVCFSEIWNRISRPQSKN